MNRITRAAAGLAALALVLIAGPVLAQTQPLPSALGPNGAFQATVPAGIMIAPAGGGAGAGCVVAKDNCPLPSAHQYGASGVSAVTGAVASSTLSSGFTPTAGRTFYLELTGTGSVTGTVVYLCNDGSTYAPNVVATDGGAPTIMDKIAYSGGTQNGVRIALQVDQAGMSVKFSPGTVTGTVNYAFVQ